MLRFTGFLRLAARSNTLRIPEISMPRIRSAIHCSCMTVSLGLGKRGYGLCNAFVGQAFQPDRDIQDSMNLGDIRRPGKADLRMRCKAGLWVNSRRFRLPAPPGPVRLFKVYC